MMDIIGKITKEVEEVIGHQCDSCGNEIKLCSPYSMDFNLIKYNVPKGSYGDEETIVKHFCSLKCLLKLLINIPFNAHIDLSFAIIREITKNTQIKKYLWDI